MREYRPKKDVQKKSYYRDRFYVAPQVPREKIEEGSRFFDDVKSLGSKFEVKDSYVEINQLVVIVESSSIFEVIGYMKNSLSYDILNEMSAIDYVAKCGGFEIFYQMLSLSTTKRARIKCFLKEGEAIESVSSHFRCADWSEREMYDMFGIRANNHPYMKRILMPDDWEGHPLLKTYPLQGDEFAQWYEVDKIFGKEYREVVGPENRDGAMIDRYDTKRFSRIGHEVEYGASIDLGEPDTNLKYQEEKGVFLIKKLKPEISKELEKRK